MLNWFITNTKLILPDLTSLLLRVAFGGMMALNHGYRKLVKWDELKVDFDSIFGMSPAWSAGLCIFAEFYCALLIVAGLFTRLATIPSIIAMLVAAFVTHLDDPFRDKEHALLFVAGFFVILLMGAGRYSLDNVFFNRKKKGV